MRHLEVVSLAVLLLFLLANQGHADIFGSGPNAFEIPFVTIGAPGNLGDDGFPNGIGAVGYSYRMSVYEIPARMIDRANAAGGLGITKDVRGPNKPATGVTWFETAAFVNWLNTSEGHAPAYKLDAAGKQQYWETTDAGYDPDNKLRNANAKYFIPSVREWYKAAYFDPSLGVYYDYPTGSDLVPDGIDFFGDTAFDAVFYQGGSVTQPNDVTDAGVFGPTGVAGLAGNVSEWVEADTKIFTHFPSRNNKSQVGGSWIHGVMAITAGTSMSTGVTGTSQALNVGIRIASAVPEPASGMLLLVATIILVVRIKR